MPPVKQLDKHTSTHARAAKARAEQARRKRQRLLWAATSSVAVVAVVVVLIAVKLGGSSHHAGPTQNVPAPTDAVAALAGIPATQLATAAASGAATPPHAASGLPPLASGGHPVVFYGGADYCPYCAAQRWPLVTALAKFGSFSGLGQTTSSSTDVYANTATFSFYGSTYSSPYLVFDAVEMQDRNGANLQALTPAQSELLTTYDVSQYTGQRSGSIPFISLGNRWFQSGAAFTPGLLAGKSVSEIAAAATDASTPIGQAVQAAAGQLTADICQLTGDQPAQVCSAFGAH